MSTATDRRAVAKSLAGFLVAAVVLYLFGRVLGWQDILAVMDNADVGWMAVACLSAVVSLVIWAKAWDLVLTVIDVHIPYRELIPIYFGATFADYVTPFGKVGGSPLVAYILSIDERATYEEGLASVLTSNVLNLVPFFTFAGGGILALAALGRVDSAIRPIVYGLGVFGLAVPLVGYVCWRHETWVISVVASIAGPLARRIDRVDAARIEHRTAEFFALLDEVATSRARLAEMVLLSFAGWILFAAPLYFAGRALGIPLSPLLVAFVVPASSLASLVPTPGGLGGVEAALVGLLVTLAAVPVDTAAAITLLYRAASFWFVLLVSGVGSAWVIYHQ